MAAACVPDLPSSVYLGSGVSVSVADMAREIARQLGRQHLLTIGDAREKRDQASPMWAGQVGFSVLQRQLPYRRVLLAPSPSNLICPKANTSSKHERSSPSRNQPVGINARKGAVLKTTLGPARLAGC